MIGVENNLETLGNLIKEARKARNLTIEKLSELTKIKIANLEAMEEDRFEQIAAPTYAKGFLKIVARLLNLNELELIKQYDARYPQKPKQVLYFAENPTARKPRKKRGSRKIWVWMASAVILLSAWIWLSPKEKPESKPVENEKKSETALPTDTVSTKSSSVKVEGAPVVNAGAISTPVIALRVQIQALSDVWVKVTADDKLVFENTVRQNQQEEWTGQEKVAIRVGRPTDVVLTVNGKPYDLTGQKKPVNLLITPGEVKKYD